MHSGSEEGGAPETRNQATPPDAARSTATYCLAESPGLAAVFRMPDKYVPWSTLRRQIGVSMRRHHDVRAKSIVSVRAFAHPITGDGDEGSRMTACDHAFTSDGCTGLEQYALHAWRDARAGFVLVRHAVDGPRNAAGKRKIR